jgi:DNA-directed RNA polymerase specialized sigma24 family protein
MPVPDPAPSRFGQISTHADELGSADALFQRYGRAIRGYLQAVLRDEDAVQDVLLQLRVKMLDGRFARWTPGRGKFRFYLKRAALNEALQYLRKQRNRPLEQQVEDLTHFPEEGPGADAGDVWLGLYRRAVFEAALKSLRAYQEQHPGNVFHTLIELLGGSVSADRGPADVPPSDADLASALGRATGREYTVANVAQQKRRARQKFAEFLAAEVALTLEEPTPEQVADELRHLGFWGFVSDFLPAGGTGADGTTGAEA